MKALTVLAAALTLATVSVRWSSFVAGGSDSSCYILQAERWAAVLRAPLTEPLQVPEPLALSAPWPQASETFAPTGHVASPTVIGASVPICPAGLSMVMAPLLLAGGRSAMLAVLPFFAALLVLAVYVAGSRFGAHVGVSAAVLVAASPIVLYQVVQPMSDIPAAALWMTAVACATGAKRRAAGAAGLAASAATVTRPNLLPLGFVIGLFLLLRTERTWGDRVRTALTYAAWCVPGCAAVAAVQHTLYGSMLSSGYGSFDALFSAGHVLPNLRNYAGWLVQSHTWAITAAPAALLLLPGPLSRLFIALFAVNLAVYLPYVEFADWSFLRFLLPTIPLLLILVAATVDAIWRRVMFAVASAARSEAVVLALVTVVLAAVYVEEARSRSAFRLQLMEARFAKAGRFVAERLPQNAFVITSYESGSVRFYSGRTALVWDALDSAWLDRSLVFARERGYEPFLLFERWEEPQFRRRFPGSSLAALDWPPAAEIASQVRIYRPDDRERYLRGERVATEFVR